MIWSRTASTLPLPAPSPPLLLPSTTHRDDLLEARHTLAHRVDYGFFDTVDASIRASNSRAMTTMGGGFFIDEGKEILSSMASSYEREAADARRA
ncbi:hypothetical protein Tco_0762327 [Tanacetum coccineum]